MVAKNAVFSGLFQYLEVNSFNELNIFKFTFSCEVLENGGLMQKPDHLYVSTHMGGN